MLDVVKACRPKPFGEWVVAYYDGTKTTPDALLERLRKNGCEKATRVEPAGAEKEKQKAAVSNPIAAPGDFFEISLEGFEKAPEIKVPEKWILVSKDKKRAVVASPGEAKTGKHAITAGGLDLSVELVPIVK